jgi:uncharacterized membrane protein
MTSPRSEIQARYEARREAAWVALCSFAALTLLAVVSRHEGWELIELPWWIWLVLAVPGLVLCVDLWLGERGVGVAGRRAPALALLTVIVVGNLVGLSLLIAALITTSSADIGGGQLLLTAAVIWLANVIAFGIWFWDVDDGGPFERANHERAHPDFQFPQDENPQLARAGWHPRVWDYLYVSLMSASAFSPTDTMPLTIRAKVLMGIESTVSLVIIVLVTARAVNVLGS